MSGTTSARVKGKVKWFNNAKGYGFIIQDGNDEDLFAHFSAIQMDGYKTLKAGQPVTFCMVQGPKGTHAVGICPVAVEAEGTACSEIPEPTKVRLKPRVTEDH
ncbi:cold shock domain-containing protein CspD [Pseudomonas frederiksbergensis]|uniref:Cold shock-like protein CspD n=1 Tax=Pseudomonas frederiksbergensis TaxID=104087 RepID=A0A0B1YY12_9PSED|nr:cold shock domain-containing protein CspD [Pseudomonas frederiksbergensis]KHK63295.1 cold-shock protein [Pseudomonas frederiksbergensis]